MNSTAIRPAATPPTAVTEAGVMSCRAVSSHTLAPRAEPRIALVTAASSGSAPSTAATCSPVAEAASAVRVASRRGVSLPGRSAIAAAVCTAAWPAMTSSAPRPA